MILLEKKILSFPSIKRLLYPPESYKNSTGQKLPTQESRKPGKGASVVLEIFTCQLSHPLVQFPTS